ncbi:SufE family protein [Leptolyngbyaceae cyanobacterium CCMR0082]|uniref:SufE family protein n=1 Tax=Adonisia turfae CCMR0082 TaxID=2304604 RepID=A0A6M0S3U2_9CYAN|nr:SufE family protein [Adonisia turfae]NEZ62723.1 SufE family protein [Adonisia turfae CCMR0082]
MSVNSARPPALDKIVKRFQRIQDPRRRYEQLLWYAKRLEGFPEDAKTPENKVKGCVSQVYILANTDEEGNVCFQGDSDAQITKGLVALLIEGLKGIPPHDIVQLEPDFIKETQLDVSLTPSRANGFYNIFKTMQQKAMALANE